MEQTIQSEKKEKGELLRNLLAVFAQHVLNADNNGLKTFVSKAKMKTKICNLAKFHPVCTNNTL